MALTVDIQARVGDVLRKLGMTEKQIEEVAAALRQSSAAANQSTAAMNQAAAASNNLGRSKGLNSTIYFQAGQAISDFAIAGVRGAANNIEYLAAQLGVGAPLLVGLSLVSAAFFAWGDDIMRAITPIRTEAKETQEALSGMLKVVSEERPDLVVLERQFPAAIADVKQQIIDLEEQIQNRLIRSGQDPASISLFAPSLFASESEKRALSDLTAVLAEFEEQYNKLRITQRAFEAARRSDAVQANEADAEALRTRLESLGLAEEAKKFDNEALITAIERGEVEGLIADLKKRHARTNREEVTELDRAKKKLEELSMELDQRRRGEIDTLNALRDQAAALQVLINRVKKLKEERQKQAERDLEFGRPQRAEAAGGDVGSIQDAIEGINRRAREEENRVRLSALSLSDAVLESVEAGQEGYQRQLDVLAAIASGADRTAAAFREAGISAEYFYTQTSEGRAELGDALSQTAGNFASAFAAAFDATNQRQREFFVAYKAFAIAEATIATYNAATQALKAGPIIGPILAAGIVAAGLANVARIAATQPGGGIGGGGSAGRRTGITSGGTIRALNEDRLAGYQGAASPPSQQIRYIPLPPASVQPVHLVGELVGEGETLRAVIRRTDRRVSVTRGLEAAT